MPPIFPRPQNLFIHSQFTFNRFRKNDPKHFKNLTIEARPYRGFDFQIPPKSLLKTFQRRVKCLRALDLGQYQQFFDLKVDQALCIIKSFPHIQSLILLADPNKYFSSKGYLKWLTQSKQLIHLTFGPLPSFCGFFLVFRSYDRPKNPSLHKALQAKYKKTLKNTKLLSLSLHSREAIVCHSDQSHPISLKKLSMSAAILLPGFHLDLSHLPNLSILHLYFPILFNNLLNFLYSLPNPHNLTHLKFYITNIPDQANRRILRLPESLNYFGSLHSINLVINSFLFVSTLLKSLTNPSYLNSLTLDIPIKDQEQLKELALLIGNLQNLSHFAIKNSKSVQDYADEGYKKFFHQISRLSRLVSLEINLCGESIHSLKSQRWNGCTGKFAKCLEKLHELSEINFTQSEYCLTDELNLLAKVLKKKGSKLKKLTIQFANKNRDVDHIGKFNTAFARMKNLEDLSIKGVWTRKESLRKFSEVVSQLKYLRYFYLDVKDRAIDQVTFPKLVKEILMKYGLEELHWHMGEIEETENFEGAEPIDMKQVALRNPQFYNFSASYPSKGVCLSFKNEEGIYP